MEHSQPHRAAAGTRLVEDVEQYDAIIIGAGVTGLYALYRNVVLVWEDLAWEEKEKAA